MGLSTIDFIDKAAPPRVSPSNFVSTTPSKFKISLKAFAVFTASCPVIASTTNKVSWGCMVLWISEISFIISSSTAKRPAVSMITTFLPFALAYFTAFLEISTGFLFSTSA